MSHRLPEEYRDGESRRVSVVGFDRIGSDAIVDFWDLEPPHRDYLAVVVTGLIPGRLRLGDHWLIRYRSASHRPRSLDPVGWYPVGRLVELGFPCPGVAAPAGIGGER
jgi:hypothetical protein